MPYSGRFLCEAKAAQALRAPLRGQDVVLMSARELRGRRVEWAVCEGAIGRAVVAVCDGRICWLGATDLGERAAKQAFESAYSMAKRHERLLPVMRSALKATPPALPLLLLGTGFQHRVWQLLLRIPRGQLVRYGDLARALGQPTAARAVGNAVGANPVAWLVPCHRVGHSDGGISGFASGEACKRRWLDLEAD